MSQFHSIPLIEAEEFWSRSRDKALLDVRSPGEFEQGHIPGAVNLPLFSNQQRAEIGTIYKNSGRDDAMLRGLKLVGPQLGELSQRARQHAAKFGTNEVCLHCWRGGLRSESVGWLLKTVGLNPFLLQGGYKSFRRLAQSSFENPWKLRVVSGLTGAGKTDVLVALRELNQQVIDLESLAHHRGSAFGSIGLPNQPTTEQFENRLFEQFVKCDPDKIVWIEDEGNRLGTVVVPPPLVQAIRNSVAIFIDSPVAERVERLMQEYGQFSVERLIESVSHIRKRLGPQHADEASIALKQGRVRHALQIVLDYYDRTYLHAAQTKMNRPEMVRLDSTSMNANQVAAKILELAECSV